MICELCDCIMIPDGNYADQELINYEETCTVCELHLEIIRNLRQKNE